MPKLRALGITCGVGSMLIPARRQGFRVVGNIEWRKYYHAKDAEGRNTFRANYPGAFFHHRVDQLDEIERMDAEDCDLAMSHPECGAFSNLSPIKGKENQEADIPIAVNLINDLRPKFFALDELPKAMVGYDLDKWIKGLPEYRLFFEWVSNYHYGNIQRNRKRMFVIGARRDQDFIFQPGEFEHSTTLGQTITIPEGVPNTEPHYRGDKYHSSAAQHFAFYGDRPTWREASEIMMKWPATRNMEYICSDGRIAERFGYLRGNWDGWANLLTGGTPLLHPKTGLPLNFRERARIQGAPDDFVFYGTKLLPEGSWLLQHNGHMQKQTGKFMPVQFCDFFTRQVKAHFEGKTAKGITRKRFLDPNGFVDNAKMDYCRKVGYDDLQKDACRECWLTDRCPMAKSRNPTWKGVEGRT